MDLIKARRPLSSGKAMFAAASPTALNDLAIIFGIGLGAVLLLIALSIAAAILKMACRVAGVEPPDTGKAMVVSFVESIVGGVVYAASTLTVGLLGTAAQLDKGTVGALVGFSAVGVTFVVPAGLYVPMLRVTFGKGLVIALLRYVITLTLILLLALVITTATGKVKLF
jgi:hypothetical protein